MYTPRTKYTLGIESRRWTIRVDSTVGSVVVSEFDLALDPEGVLARTVLRMLEVAWESACYLAKAKGVTL